MATSVSVLFMLLTTRLVCAYDIQQTEHAVAMDDNDAFCSHYEASGFAHSYSALYLYMCVLVYIYIFIKYMTIEVDQNRL